MEMFAYHRYHTKQSIVTTIREEKEIKWIPNWGKKVKLLLFADDMILYIENPKYVTRKLLELINEFGQIADRKLI